MGEIDFTNIVIDDFRKGKLNPFNKYIYILTHIHSDHLRGLNNSWDYGPIYCTQITANLILNKFPNLTTCVRVLPLEEPCKITLAQNTLATVTLFDANHCAGSVMVLLEGYFGRFLYTGDFRFDKNKFKSYSYLYPPENYNQKFEGCSRPIDKMWLDNTFCNPKFKFLAQKQALELVKDFVKSTQKRIYIGMDYYGKQQVLAHLASELDMIIVVDEQRYETIIAMQFDRQLFTTNPQQGRVEVIQKPKLHDKLVQDKQALGLVMSGWCIKKEWRRVKGTQEQRIFYIPYSLHSNYEEIVAFVKSVKPSMIEPIVHSREQQSGVATNQSMYNTDGNAEAFKHIVSKFTSPISITYQNNLNDKQFQDVLKKRLGLDRKTAEINKKQLQLNTIMMPARGKGYKITNQRNQSQIEKAKEDYRRSRDKKIKASSIVINDKSSSDEDSSLQFISSPSKIISQMNQQTVRKQRIKQINAQILKKPQLSQINKIKLIKGEELRQIFRLQVRKAILNIK